MLIRRRDAALAAGDSAGAEEWNASLRVINTKIIPLACAATVWVAGRASRAAYEGRNEQEWYRAVSSGLGERERDELDMAVVLLRAADLWPWEDARPVAAPRRAAN
ncbi:MAG: hypothetical protein R6X33_17845 [Candidatus Brocadiia bacterium]